MEARIEYQATYSPERLIDDGWEGREPEQYFEKCTITFVRNGEIIGDALLHEIFSADHPCANTTGLPAGVTLVGYITTPYGRLSRFATDGLDESELKKAYEELRHTEAPADVLRMIRAEEDAKRKADVREAQTILGCKNVFPDEASMRRWRKNYNDCMNEGGEGYMPFTVTVAQVEWARKVLET
jgi:hypothetical protein